MPFQITGYTLPNTGAPCTYFVLERINVNVIQQNIQVQVAGYVSQADFTANLQPVTQENFNINGATYAAFLAAVTAADIPAGTPQGTVLTQLIGALQTNMLTLPFFSGATIVS